MCCRRNSRNYRQLFSWSWKPILCWCTPYWTKWTGIYFNIYILHTLLFIVVCSYYQLSYSIHLKGQGWSNNVYVLDGETVGPTEESMGAVISPPDDHPPPPKSLLVMLVCHSGEGQSSPVTKEIQIGYIKTPLVKKVWFLSNNSRIDWILKFR